MMKITNIIAGVRCSAPCVLHVFSMQAAMPPLGGSWQAHSCSRSSMSGGGATADCFILNSVYHYVVKASLIDSFMSAATHTCHTH